MSSYRQVYDFHVKFNQLRFTTPGTLSARKLEERIHFLLEEIGELCQAGGFELKYDLQHQDDNQDLALQADALIDLVYVAMGTAVMMGLPWECLWEDVHRANMAKAQGVGKRGNLVDVIKPLGWEAPHTEEILLAYGYHSSNPPEERDDPVHLTANNDL